MPSSSAPEPSCIDNHPLKFYLLQEPEISVKLRDLANAQQLFTSPDISSISFQPCVNPAERIQDRHVVERWSLPDGEWTFCAVFDGHTGAETSGYTVRVLPSIIQKALSSAIASLSSRPSSSDISKLLETTIKRYDDSLRDALLDIFPESPEDLARLSDAEIRRRLADDRDGSRRGKVLRCMRGTTALVSLTDPSANNLWVASLGDCRAVLGRRETPSSDWSTEILSFDHNASNPEEVVLIRSTHPGEQECVVENHVLGAIAVTRAIGDHLFKLPAVYAKRIFSNVEGGLRFSSQVSEWLDRNQSPPYVSNVAQVQHVNLRTRAGELVLILASDGLADLDLTATDLVESSPQAQAHRWVTSAFNVDGGVRALQVLRDALGGDDTERVSRMITLQSSSRWTDDVSIVVQVL